MAIAYSCQILVNNQPHFRDDFFGRAAYDDLDSEWLKWTDDKGRMPLTCHLYSCG